MSLTKKINDLFELRQLPELCAGSKIKKGSPYYKNLIKLQKAIYFLDDYLENNWETKSTALNKHWKEIYSILSDLKIPKSQHKDYVKHILKYQKHELMLRDGRLPFELTMEYYYFYKSCDVKLIRRLIYNQLPALEKSIGLSDWRLFDLITEIHDDVEDVYEDVGSINGNSFLINLNSKGLEQTFKEFQEMINFVEWRLDEKYMKSKKESIQQLYTWTKEAVMHLNILLMKRKEEISSKGIPGSKVLDLLNEGL